jgi:hypothetical protein
LVTGWFPVAVRSSVSARSNFRALFDKIDLDRSTKQATMTVRTLTTVRILTLLVAAIPVIGCDAWFFRRMEVTIPEQKAFAVSASSTSTLTLALREYSAEHRLYCPESDQLPFECFRQPRRIWAYSTDRGAVVCFHAMGAQFEANKFGVEMQRLDTLLREGFGSQSVSSAAMPCEVSPPSSQRRAESKQRPGP